MMESYVFQLSKGRGRATESEKRKQQESVSSGARKRREDISDSLSRGKGSGGRKPLTEASRCAWWERGKMRSRSQGRYAFYTPQSRETCSGF